MGKPLVSVVIPAFNMGRFIADSVRSALTQTYSHVEIIVIDDGSTDDTHLILGPFIDDGLILYHYQNNSGLSAARNVGIFISKGEYVALLDADDLWEPSKLEMQVDVVKRDLQAGLVFSDFATFDESGIIAAKKSSVIIQQIPMPDFRMMIRRNNFIYPSTALIRRSVFKECGYFDVELTSIEDYDMWLRIAKKFSIVGIDEPLAKIRQHSSNMSKNIPRMLDNEIVVISKYRDLLATSTFRRRIAKIFLLNADRSIHNGERVSAIKYLMRGMFTLNAPPIDIFVVILKMVLGNRNVEFLRRRSDKNNNLISKLYEIIYKRY